MIGQLLAALLVTVAVVVLAGVPLNMHDPAQIRRSTRRNR